jgi:hypothetical protein
MSTSRPFTYNPGSIIPGTEKFGNLSVGIPTAGFESTGLQWWNGPNEDLGYVIAKTNVDISGNPLQPTPIIGQLGNVAFNRTKTWMYSELVGLSNLITGQNFTTPDDSKTWLESNGYWTSWERSIPNDIKNFTDSVIFDMGFIESENTINDYINEIGTGLYDTASLFITPNGVDEGKLFSLKPSDRSGDMIVSRSTSGSRISSDSLIEPVPYNLFPGSENFSLSRFNYYANVVIATNIGGSPIGTNTVTKYSPSASVNSYLAFSNSVRFFYTNSIINISVYAKIGECTTFDLGGYFGNESAIFNLQTGVITPRSANVLSYSMEDVEDGWYRCKVTYKFTNPIGNGFLYAGITRVVSPVYNGINGMYFWGFQVTETSNTLPYFPTINRINLPRISYINANPYILIEPQRTNLFTFSAGNLSTYGISGGAISNALSSINGFTNSIQIGTNFSYAYKTTFAPVIGTGYYLSVFIQMDDNSIPVGGTSTSTGDFVFVFSGQLLPVTKIQRIGTSDVYRCSAYRVATGTSASIGVIKYSTQSIKPFRFTGIQLEVGTNETSYIETLGSTATRNTDVVSKTGVSGLIGQTEGTIYIEAFMNDNRDQRISGIEGLNGLQNRIIFNYGATRYAVQFVSNNVFTQIFTDINRPLGKTKLCVKYGGGAYKFFHNGLLIGTNSSPTPISMDKINLGTTPSIPNNEILNGGIKSFIVWKTQLTDQQCIDLTTL